MKTPAKSTVPPKPAAAGTSVNAALLDLLLRCTEPVAVESIAKRLAQPTSQTLHDLDQLRQAGCRIEAHPQLGLSLQETGLGVWSDYLKWSRGGLSHKPVEVYAQTTSTQDAARRLIGSDARACDGAVVVADEQTAGRGRLGRQWVAPRGTAVTFSRVCLINESDLSIDRLTLASVVGAAQAIEPHLHAKRVQIKWPNDLLIDGRKIAGILVETFTPTGSSPTVAAVIGVGINVSLPEQHLPPEHEHLRESITSVHAAGQPADRLLVLADTLRQLDEALTQPDPAHLLQAWRSRCPLLAQTLTLRNNGRTVRGQILDLDPSAGLIVRTDSGAVVHLPAATTTVL